MNAETFDRLTFEEKLAEVSRAACEASVWRCRVFKHEVKRKDQGKLWRSVPEENEEHDEGKFGTTA